MFVCFLTADVKKDHCNKTVDIYEDVSSPEVTPENLGKPMTCWYRFRSFRGTPKDWILRIKFNKFKVGTLLNASHCQGGYMQVISCSFCFAFPSSLKSDKAQFSRPWRRLKGSIKYAERGTRRAQY